ncbi:hypothetical protein [Dendrosporobacter sp. 1207_IL3150]|uniref:hypothetical protein n=1 Tax=Dendrosporobacter sp. 1207_IL3150 TaxID=3084054 RepID=UPI002FD8D694
MRKIITGTLAALMLTSSVAFANLDDNKETIDAKYGEYRLIVDTDNQIWAKAEWETKGAQRAKPASYMHSFTRADMRTQMEVTFAKDGMVRAQRFTPDMAIKIKDFKKYYPEVYTLIKSPKAEAFASYKTVTNQFQESQSPVTMGVIVKEMPQGIKGAYYSLLVFNIQDDGRLVKDGKFITEDTSIREFTIERVFRSSASNALDSGDWQLIKNFF